MKQICLARALFLIGICIIYQLFVVRGGGRGQHGKLSFLFLLFRSFLSLANKYTICHLQERKGSERFVGEWASVCKWYR